jgi:TonB family protein
MYMAAKMIMVLPFIGPGVITLDSSGSSHPTQAVVQPVATTPGDANGQESSMASPPSGSNPDASRRYHVGNGVSAPELIYSVNPEFTDKARRKKLGGTCVVSILVDVNGTPQDVHVLRSIASTVSPKLHSAAMGLDENAIKAARQYRFKPGTYHGKPVPVELKLEVNYRIY